jgi:hypothetical protein
VTLYSISLGTRVYISNNCESDQEGGYNGRDSYDSWDSDYYDNADDDDADNVIAIGSGQGGGAVDKIKLS